MAGERVGSRHRGQGRSQGLESGLGPGLWGHWACVKLHQGLRTAWPDPRLRVLGGLRPAGLPAFGPVAPHHGQVVPPLLSSSSAAGSMHSPALRDSVPHPAPVRRRRPVWDHWGWSRDANGAHGPGGGSRAEASAQCGSPGAGGAGLGPKGGAHGQGGSDWNCWTGCRRGRAGGWPVWAEGSPGGVAEAAARREHVEVVRGLPGADVSFSTSTWPLAGGRRVETCQERLGPPWEVPGQCCRPSGLGGALAREHNVCGPESVGLCPCCPLGASVSQPEEETGWTPDCSLPERPPAHSWPSGAICLGQLPCLEGVGQTWPVLGTEGRLAHSPGGARAGQRGQ